MMQTALAIVYPHQCAMCDAFVAERGGLCAGCWGATPFIEGLVCDQCGTPLPGEDEGTPGDPGPAPDGGAGLRDGEAPRMAGEVRGPRCDDCMVIGRPWCRGRAALLYRDKARHLVLALKHGDRLDLVHPAAGWMARAGAPVLTPGSLLVPVPSHWTRLLKRRYNQAALLARAIARIAGCDAAPRSLVRVTRTSMQDGKSVAMRFDDLDGAIRAHPRHGAALDRRAVVIVDDVMTSGATLAACTDACLAAGAARVDILVLARVERD